MATFAIPRKPVRALHISARVVLGAVVGGLVGCLLVALFATRLLGYQIATVQSHSMEPSLSRGDIVVSRPVDIQDVKTGDIVFFEEGTATRLLVVHRVLNTVVFNTNIHNERTGEDTHSVATLLQTKGDANEHPDGGLVGEERLRGKLLFAAPGIGFVFAGLPLQKALLLLAGASFGTWMAYEAVRSSRLRRRRL